MQQHLSSIVDLTQNLPEWVEFGFSSSTGHLSELHFLCSWSFDMSIQKPAPSDKLENSSKRKLVAGLIVGGCILISGLGFVWFMSKWKKQAEGTGGDQDFPEPGILTRR